MSWLRIEDGFLENPKITGLSDRAFRLHMAGLTYCARNLTDGQLDCVATRVILALVRAKKGHVFELNSAGLWSESGTGYVVNDYLEYNPDAATAKALRETRKLAGKQGAAKRWGQQDDGKSHSTSDSKSYGNPNGKPHGIPGMPRPVPSRISNPVTATEDVARAPDPPGNGNGGELTGQELEDLAASVLEDAPL